MAFSFELLGTFKDSQNRFIQLKSENYTTKPIKYKCDFIPGQCRYDIDNVSSLSMHKIYEPLSIPIPDSQECMLWSTPWALIELNNFSALNIFLERFNPISLLKNDLTGGDSGQLKGGPA